METVNGIVRALLSAGAGYLLGKGYITQSDVEPLVGAFGVIFTAVWSVLAKSDKFPKIK